MSTDKLNVLLIEDNPGDARLVKERIRDIEGLLQRVDVGRSIKDEVQLHHERRLSAGLEHLSDSAVDVVLLDLGLPDSTGLDTLATVVDATEFVPIVVLTGLSDEQVGIEAIQRGAQDYLVKGEVTSDLLVRSIHHAIERNHQEREQAQQVEQLEALNRLNRISQDITHAVITTSTREDLERAVCERLVDSDAYRFAWIGEVDRSTDRITPRVSAGGDDEYLDEITITTGSGDTGQGPSGKAARTREVQVVNDIQTDPAFEPWREHAKERGYRSSVAVPIGHENLLYGILCIYALSPNAFSEPEVEILSRLGDIIGHAITAIERKNALVSDTIIELEFTVKGVGEELVALSTAQAATIEIESVVRNNETTTAYGRADGVSQEEFHDAAEQADRITEHRILKAEGDGVEFELVTDGFNSLFTAVAARGGTIESAVIADGKFRFVVQFPPGHDKRKLAELVEEHCAGAVPHAQRTVQRHERDVSSFLSVFQSQLTEKQHTALETAYFSGFFDWPRTSTGEEVADRLDVTPATFTNHLRAAERKFFDEVFEAEGTENRADSSDWSSLDSDSKSQ